MANSFSKEERVAFDQVVEGFEDFLLMSRLVKRYNTNQTEMARSNDTIWRPQPYIGVSYEGTDQTLNFGGNTQLAVPAYINRHRSVPLQFSANDLRDALQEDRLGDAAKQKLASDVNVAILEAITNYGTLFVKRSGVNDGFAAIGAAAAVMNAQGIPASGRVIALSTADYNDAALNLIGSARSFDNPTSNNALREAQIGRISAFETYMLDYALRLAPATAVGITINTLLAGGNRYVPAARSVALTGESVNKDNRFQTVTVNSTTNIKAGDVFTIAGVFAAHHITKQSTGVLKTFRVIGTPPSATTMVISPPIVDVAGVSQAEKAYGNVVITAASATAAIVFQNTVDGFFNPFWSRDAIEILPGKVAVPTDAGMQVMRTTTPSGFEVLMIKQSDVNTLETKIRFDIKFGVVNLQPEMTGGIMFSQT